MQNVDVVIIGAGQAGLAMSRCLGAEGIAHVLLERGRIAERWCSERWDSLRTLTPNWQTRLPGHHYRGDDPHGFMASGEVAEYLGDYARRSSAPVLEQTLVSSVRRDDGGFVIATQRGRWHARAVVIATGECGVPRVPDLADNLSTRIHQLPSKHYRRPGQLPAGGVLVVGASASGAQLADELRSAGRDVTLAVGTHARVPRSYRGRDIMAWLDAMGALSRPIDSTRRERAAQQPSFQLVGRPAARAVDLPALRARGVRLCGRVTAIEATRVQLANDLPRTTADAQQRMVRLLERIDDFADARALGTTPDRPGPFTVTSQDTEVLDLQQRGISTVLWATGFRPHLPWLHVPVLDRRGGLQHQGGITPVGGLYAIGLRAMRTAGSTFIDGVGADARALTPHIAGWLAATARPSATGRASRTEDRDSRFGGDSGADTADPASTRAMPADSA